MRPRAARRGSLQPGSRGSSSPQHNARARRSAATAASPAGRLMDVLIQYQYRASKKEPFGLLLRRLNDGLVAASLPVSYEFGFADSPVGGGVSAVDRAVKKFPQVAALVRTESAPGILGPAHKMIHGGGEDLPFGTLAEVADGLPRSLPFHSARVRFSGPAFGVGPPLAPAGFAICSI